MAIHRGLRRKKPVVRIMGPKRLYVKAQQEFSLPHASSFGEGVHPKIWIDYLTLKLKELKKAKYKDIVLKEGYGASLDYFEFKRLETDAEYARRMDKEDEVRRIELAQLKRLQEKYNYKEV